MNNISSYAPLLALLNKRHKTRFSPDAVLRQRTNSIVFGDKKRVVEFFVAGGLLVSPAQEGFEMRARLSNLGGNLFVLPQAIAWNKNPDYLLMDRQGDFLGHREHGQQHYRRAAEAVGEFAGKIWKLGRLIHTNISEGGLTLRPDGKIGILDLESVREADYPEKMFLTPLGGNVLPCATIARAFTKETGIVLDFARIASELPQQIIRHEESLLCPDVEARGRAVNNQLTAWSYSLSSSPRP